MESENDEDFISYNAHTWLDVTNAVQIVNTIAENAKDLYPQDEIKILDIPADDFIGFGASFRSEIIHIIAGDEFSFVDFLYSLIFHELFLLT